jgi:hypothetical protein
MELSRQIIAELRSLVERVAVGQPTPAKKFLFETLFGLLSSNSVLLIQVGRKLSLTGTLHAVEKRLSRQLGSARWDEATLIERYVAWVAPQVRPDTVPASDVSDIRKTYADRHPAEGDPRSGTE